MVTVLLALSSISTQSPVVASFDGEDAGIRVVQRAGSLHAEFMVYERSKGFVVAAVTAGHPSAKVERPEFVPMQFDQAKETDGVVVLTGKAFMATIQVPHKGGVFSIAISAKAAKGSLKDAMFGVALAPLEVPAKATFSYAPGTGLVAQERFATPLALACGAGYGVALMPSVQDLTTNRPMSPVLELDKDGRTGPGAILSYGFAPYDRDDEWKPKRADRNLDNPEQFTWKFDLLVTREAQASHEANQHLWSRDGVDRFQSPLPQTIPFRYYTKPTYDIETGIEQKSLWWTSPDKEAAIKVPVAADGLARLTTDANLARYAYGFKWWGEELLQMPWNVRADEVMNLIVSAPERPGMTPVTFDTATNSWRFEPFDVGATAVTARFKLKYVEDFAHKSEERLIEQVTRSAKDLMATSPNGSSALFLQEFSQSKAINDDKAKSDARDFLIKHQDSLRTLGENYTAQSSGPSVESVSLALYLSRTDGRAVASRMLDRIFLHQAVWQPVTVKGTEVFGAFVGEHMSEESQSEYSADLLDTVLTLGRRDCADRAVAALRAPLALFAHGTHGISGMQYPSYIPMFHSSPWFGLNGQAEFGKWRGAAEGIGQTLTTLAQVTSKYGSLFTHKDGWTLGIDGVTVIGGVTYSSFSHNPLAFEGVFPYEHVDASIDGRTSLRDPELFPAMRSLTLLQQEDGLYVLALPGFTAVNARDTLSGTFVFADGSTRKAEFLPTGFGTKATNELLAKGLVAFNGRFKDIPLTVKPTSLLAEPPAPNVAWPMGWRWMRGLSDVVASTLSVDGKSVLSTADNGRGGRDLALTGVIESQLFLITDTALKFTLLGKRDASTFVELIDPKTGVVIASAQKRTDGVEEVTWELFDVVGQSVAFRVVDESRTGAVEVRDLRVARIDPD